MRLNHSRMTSVAQVFVTTAKRHPLSPAISYNNEVISYSRLEKVTRICASKHFERGQVVVVGIDEGRDLAGIELAVWRAGGAVCPFDVKRDPRASFVLARLKPDWIVISNNDDTQHQFPFKTVKASALLDWDNASSQDNEEEEELENSGQEISHLVFTSGTTGQPKCVGVSNESLLSFARAKVERSRITQASRIFLASSFTFDPQLGDVACAFISGACLILPHRQALLNGMFGRLLVESKATHVCTTPAALAMLGDDVSDEQIGENLEEILVGGEKMPCTLVERAVTQWKGRPRLVNTYGVTECCVYQSTREISRLGDECELGDAYSGVDLGVFVFKEDSSRRAAKPGEEGEICISGSFLGQGYLRDDAANADSQGDHNNKKTKQSRHRREFEQVLGFQNGYYRTGDIGRLTNEDGNESIVFLGRKDAQFKINGVRIEAGEVEHAMHTQTAGLVKQCVALSIDGKLVCAVAFTDANVLLQDGRRVPTCLSTCLLRYLAKALPTAYIPSAFYAFRTIPLSPTGKIDRTKLTQDVITGRLSDSSSLAPEDKEDEEYSHTLTDLERFISKVWCEILGLPEVEVTDSFTSLGGDSLQALRAVNMILKELREEAGQEGIVARAIAEAQGFGEIQGPFSAGNLLMSYSLKSYVQSLAPYLHGSKAFTHSQDLEEGLTDEEDVDPQLEKALMDASRLGLAACIRAILQLGVVPPDGRFIPRKRMCRTPLHCAAQHGRVDAVRVLVEEFNAKVVVVTSARVSPVHLAACQEDDDPQVLLLLIHHARLQRQGNFRPLLIEDKNGQTPLHFAARSGKHGIVRALIHEQKRHDDEAQASISLKGGIFHAVNLFDRWRRTPLHWAVVNLHLEVCRVLLEEGARVIPDGLRVGRPGPSTHLVQETPLQIAVRRNAPNELIDLLKRAEQQQQTVVVS